MVFGQMSYIILVGLSIYDSVALPRPYGTDRISYPMWIFLPEEIAYYLHCFAVPRGSDGEVLGPKQC
jgi:hypothetical protein